MCHWCCTRGCLYVGGGEGGRRARVHELSVVMPSAHARTRWGPMTNLYSHTPLIPHNPPLLHSSHRSQSPFTLPSSLTAHSHLTNLSSLTPIYTSPSLYCSPLVTPHNPHLLHLIPPFTPPLADLSPHTSPLPRTALCFVCL